jgi:hypothetical protein
MMHARMMPGVVRRGYLLLWNMARLCDRRAAGKQAERKS